MIQKDIHEEWKKISNKDDSLTLRERILIFTTVLVGLYFLWQSVLYGLFLPNVKEIAERKRTITQQIDSES